MIRHSGSAGGTHSIREVIGEHVLCSSHSPTFPIPPAPLELSRLTRPSSASVGVVPFSGGNRRPFRGSLRRGGGKSILSPRAT
jgi:hypothetical protein